MRDAREASTIKDFGARSEVAKVEGCVLKQLPRSAVCREIHLEAAIKPESIHDVCANASAHRIRCFKDGPVGAALLQRVRAGKASKTRANDRCA
jgi:hypothetical protein